MDAHSDASRHAELPFGPPPPATVSPLQAVLRAVTGRCPNCGEGRFFKSYLKQVDRCAVCDEPFAALRADDGPAWLTIIVVGHIIVPLMLHVEMNTQWPYWLSMSVWTTAVVGLSLLLLPRAKAVFLAIIWATRAPGFGEEPLN